MAHIVRINVETRDRPRRSNAHGNGTLAGACARARRIKEGKRAIGSAHVAVMRVARISVFSRRDACRIGCASYSALASAEDETAARGGGCACARRIEGGNRAIGSAHEAVSHIVRINVDSRDRARRVSSIRSQKDLVDDAGPSKCIFCCVRCGPRA